MDYKDKYIIREKGLWVVRHDVSKKTLRSFEREEDAMDYAGIISFNGSDYIGQPKIKPMTTGTTNAINRQTVSNASPVSGKMNMASSLR